MGGDKVVLGAEKCLEMDDDYIFSCDIETIIVNLMNNHIHSLIPTFLQTNNAHFLE